MFVLDYALGGGNSGEDGWERGTRTSSAAGRSDTTGSAKDGRPATGGRMADGAQGATSGQWLGIVGVWQGAWSEQGILPMSTAGRPSAALAADMDCMAAETSRVCIPPSLLIPIAKPLPATMRWRKNRLARSRAERRRRIIVVGTGSPSEKHKLGVLHRRGITGPPRSNFTCRHRAPTAWVQQMPT